MPARTDGGTVSDGAARLACYRSKAADGEPRFTARTVSATDQLGALDLIAVKPRVLCVPAAEVPLP